MSIPKPKSPAKSEAREAIRSILRVELDKRRMFDFAADWHANCRGPIKIYERTLRVAGITQPVWIAVIEWHPEGQR